uniref:Cap-specific mRNA (nucleoside-2'-O-)-methyltransferase 2 n=1 Tax=Neogobius melanostomus TaxID=47308 RepID=A0A8C6UHG8_9GOBI
MRSPRSRDQCFSARVLFCRMNPGNGTKKKAMRQGRLSAVDVDPDTVAEIQSLFSKIKTYTKPSNGGWCLPEPNVSLKYPGSEHSHLQTLKTSLNAVKNQLSDKNVQVWHQHTTSTNRAGKVIAVIRSVANAEICTQAWCKFYEILGTFNLIPEQAVQNGELNTVHLCEAPGAFISALNHYIKTSDKTRYCDWSWAANTLNPYHEANGGGTTIADDRMIANTLPWWFFGSDNTGNIMIQKHLLELQAFVGNMHRVELVTADGSFDCQENPDEQEALVASLHYCEATAALLLLSPGGSFVLKMFTLYEHSSVSLLYLLNCCFHSVHVFKPATSKAGNSEVYVVCLGYDAKEAVRPLLSKLIRNYGPNLANQEALFPNTVIPDSFMKQHEDMCLYFHKLQVETITENLYLFKGMSSERRQRLDHVRDSVAQEYLQRFKVTFLPRSRWISRNTVTPACYAVSAGRPLGQKKQTGSFNERRELQTLSWRERIHRSFYAPCVQRHCTEPAGTGSLLQGPLTNCQVASWYIIVGAALPAVSNSAFCEAGLLNYLNEALGSAQSLDWTRVSCTSCHAVCPGTVLSDVAGLCTFNADNDEHKRQCLVFGCRSVWEPFQNHLRDFDLTFWAEPLFPQTGCILLHDGEPLYQQELLNCVVVSLQRLHSGDALLLPLFSALSRVAAAAVLCLHMCFRTVKFRCPSPSASVGALLLCTDFCPEAAVGILPVLKEVQVHITQLLEEKVETDKRQVLQFVPIEELLTQGLTQFLWNVNSEIIQHKLHLLMQPE